MNPKNVKIIKGFLIYFSILLLGLAFDRLPTEKPLIFGTWFLINLITYAFFANFCGTE